MSDEDFLKKHGITVTFRETDTQWFGPSVLVYVHRGENKVGLYLPAAGLPKLTEATAFGAVVDYLAPAAGGSAATFAAAVGGEPEKVRHDYSRRRAHLRDLLRVLTPDAFYAVPAFASITAL